MTTEIQKQLDRIERNSLLAAKNVLDINDVALLVNLSKSRVYQLTCKHQIPYYKPNGKLIYFDKVEIENWLKKNRIATNEEVEQKAVDYIVNGKLKGGAR